MFQVVGYVVFVLMVMVVTLIVGSFVRALVVHVRERSWSSVVGDVLFLGIWAILFGLNFTVQHGIVWEGFWLRVVASVFGIVLGVGAVVWRARRGVADGR